VVLEPARAQVAAAADRAAEGDFRGAAAAGVKAIGVGVTTGIAIGEVGAAAVDALHPAPTSGTATTGGSRRFSADQRGKAFEKAKDANGLPRCEHCGEVITTAPGQPNSYEADHRVPHSRGGPSTDENLAPSCRTCNRSKGARTPEEWK
jgi:hypothetical protein